MEFRNIQKKVPHLVESVGGRNVNTYSIAIQCISHDILKFVPYEGERNWKSKDLQ